MKKVAAFILTARCNLGCEFCVSGREKDMSTEFVKQKIDSLPASIERVVFAGGEVLLRDDIFDLCKYAKDKGYHVTVNTNGTMMDKLIANKKFVDRINLPIDGPLSIHNFMRAEMNFEQVIDGIKRWDKEVSVTTCVTKINLSFIRSIPEIIEQFDNIISWRLFRFKASGNGAVYQEKFSITDAEWDAVKDVKAKCETKFIDDIEDTSGWINFIDH